MGNDGIIISGMVENASGEPVGWRLEQGRAFLVCDSGSGEGSALLDHLAGRRPDKRLKISLSSPGGPRPLHGLPSVGLLPPPGDEIFVGTTIGEQLNFFAAGDFSQAVEQSGLDKLFGFDFAGRPGRSVWELGAGERRCLLLVSQALAGPGYWVLHQPLARMDGPRTEAVRRFVGLRCAQGDTVIACSARPEELLGCCSDLLSVSEVDGRLGVRFHGGGRQALRFLSHRTGISPSALETALDLTGAS